MDRNRWPGRVPFVAAWIGLSLGGCLSPGLELTGREPPPVPSVVPSAVHRLSTPAAPLEVVSGMRAGKPVRQFPLESPVYDAAQLATSSAGWKSVTGDRLPLDAEPPARPGSRPSDVSHAVSMTSPIQPAQFSAPKIAAPDMLAPPPTPVGELDGAAPGHDRAPADQPLVGPAAEWAGPTHPIDFASVLTLTAGQNPQVAFARAQIDEAFARWQAAEVLWLPSIRIGTNYNKHEGRIQDVAGNVFDTSRIAAYGGLGARGIGAGSPTFPGIFMNFHVADAIYRPRIAEQAAGARQQAAQATTNDELLESALAYLALLEALQAKAIAAETLANADDLARLTADFARTGQGTQADADRAAAALAFQRNRVIQADEAVVVASARLAEQLHLDPTRLLVPIEPAIVPIHLVACEPPVQELVATALASRPELAQAQRLVSEAVQRLRREKHAPWLPSIWLGMDYGGMGGGLGNTIANSSDRWDFDAAAYWEVRQLGFGEQAARAEAGSLVDQAGFRQVQVMDTVAREVVEAHAQVQSRQQQIGIAQGAVEAALDSYRRNVERIRDGEGLPIEALQSMSALDEARREYLRAVVEYNEAQFRLHRALGWPIH